MKRQGGAGTEQRIRKKAHKSKRTTITQGYASGKSQLSDRQKHILYTFDVLGTYGEAVQLEVSPADVEALLRQCSEMLRKLSECKSPINADTWKGLGKISVGQPGDEYHLVLECHDVLLIRDRDGLVKLVEQKLEAEHNMSSTLKFDSLDSEEMGSVSHNMNDHQSECAQQRSRDGKVCYHHHQEHR